MITSCPKCKAKNRLPTDGDADQLGRPVCASCGYYLFSDNFESETNSSSTTQIGIVYIHKHIKGQNVKVGETKSNSADRLRDYSKAHSLEGFIRHKDYEVPLKARQDVEKRAHNILKSQGFGMSFGTAREIFACTPEIAEAAVEKAIAESEVNRIELAKQRQQQIKRDKLAKAQAKYDEQLEKFIEGWLREWEASQWVKSKRLSLDEFDAANSFEKKGKRNFGDYCWLGLGWYFMLVGVGFVLGTLRSIFDPASSMSHIGQVLMLGTMTAVFCWMGSWLIKDFGIVLPLPDEEALAQKAAMEEEIETKKQTIIANATNDFEKHFTLQNFYD